MKVELNGGNRPIKVLNIVGVVAEDDAIGLEEEIEDDADIN